MRVCVTGSHSTGKTTLANSLFSELCRRSPGEVSLIPETARILISRGLPMAKETTLEAAVAYVELQLRSERVASARHVIADRSVLDLLAYLEVNKSTKVDTAFVDMLREIVFLETRFFEFYAFVPIESSMTQDSARPDDERYRHRIEERILGALSEFQVRVIRVEGTEEERLKALLALA